jgi:hypothetical protein
MRYIIYKITNNINGRYYIGRHATNNINDGYMGSGKGIINAIKKYGIESFTKEIIAESDSIESLWNLEKQIVNERIVKDPLSYNMAYGGKSYLDGLKKYDYQKFLEHQSDAGKVGGRKCYENKTHDQLKSWHSKGGIVNAETQKLKKSHPFYTGEAASAGGKALRGMCELWNPKSLATNKNQKEYQSGDCMRVKKGSLKYTELIEQGWLTIETHKQTYYLRG